MYRHRVIFDEVQKAPALFNHIKLAVDRDRNTYGKFVLTGSSQFLLMQNVADSLAGRIGLLSLLPFDHRELPKALCETAIWRGCYPELVTRHYRNADDWYASYIETYLARDVRDVAQIGNLRDFRNLIQLLAANTAQFLNMSRLASDLGVTIPTIKRWISILEMSYVIFLLPPYFRNFGKRVIKRPKIYFYDTGLVSALTGIRTEEMYDRGPMAGALFENYILSQILKHHKHTNQRAELYFYRTSHGVEIDLVIDTGQTRHFVEIKKNRDLPTSPDKNTQHTRFSSRHSDTDLSGRITTRLQQYSHLQLVELPHPQKGVTSCQNNRTSSSSSATSSAQTP